MERPIQSRRELAAEMRSARRNAVPNDGKRAHRKERVELVYDLRQPDGSSDRFYEEVAAFSDRLLEQIDLRAGPTVRAYSCFVQSQLREPPRSLGEYSMELLTLGMTVVQYGGAAGRAPGWAVRLARNLFTLRRKSSWIKPATDLARAVLTRHFLMPRSDRKPTPPRASLDRLPRLVEWMQATGEYEQEADRLENWRRFLALLPRAEAGQVVAEAEETFHWFQREAARALGSYTRGVPAFLAGPYARRGCREDQIFCGRQPVEYHLSMVAAEVMNRGLREEFDRKQHRVVLVPTCMRGAHAAGCRARTSGMDTVCTACDPECAVNQVTRRMRSLGAKVCLIPHSTGFSHWLERWQRAPEFGVVAVACMLNILPGGFEMRARGIASQCVPLDYPGCHKHWSAMGIPTGLNEDRLAQLVQIESPRSALGSAKAV